MTNDAIEQCTKDALTADLVDKFTKQAKDFRAKWYRCNGASTLLERQFDAVTVSLMNSEHEKIRLKNELVALRDADDARFSAVFWMGSGFVVGVLSSLLLVYLVE